MPYRTAGARAVAFVVVLQDSNVLRPGSERACRRTTAVPFFSELERCHLIHGKRVKLSLRVEALKERTGKRGGIGTTGTQEGERRCTGYGILAVGWTKIQPREGSL